MNAKVEWLGQFRVGLGALSFPETVQGKALLASWNATDGNNCTTGYGMQASDTDASGWFDRDGRTLACFTNWWNKSNMTPALPPVTTKNGVAWVDLDAQHLSALQQWGLSKGVINPGQIPVPGFPAPQPQPFPVPPAPVADLAGCLAQCAQQYGLDPIGAANCVAACNAKYPNQLPAPPPVPSPLPSPPAPIPVPAPPATSSDTSSGPGTGILVLGALAALAAGGLIVAGTRPRPPRGLQENWTVSAQVGGHAGRRRKRRSRRR